MAQEGIDPLHARASNIWLYKQNRPSLICRDLEPWVPPRVTALVLMARGVCKWLSVRRDLIRLKNEWRSEIRHLQWIITSREVRRGSPEHREIVGRLKAYEECRAAIRKLCHSERWVVPDNDEKFRRLLPTEETP